MRLCDWMFVVELGDLGEVPLNSRDGWLGHGGRSLGGRRSELHRLRRWAQHLLPFSFLPFFGLREGEGCWGRVWPNGDRIRVDPASGSILASFSHRLGLRRRPPRGGSSGGGDGFLKNPKFLTWVGSDMMGRVKPLDCTLACIEPCLKIIGSNLIVGPITQINKREEIIRIGLQV